MGIDTTVMIGGRQLNTPQDVFAYMISQSGTYSLPKHWVSDLFHDARWLDLHWADLQKDRETFYWGLRETGTAIGTSRREVLDIVKHETRFCFFWKGDE